MNEKIETIKNLIKQRKILRARALLKELDMNLERMKELEEFASEVKRIARNTGRSRSIDISELEPLFVKYKIKLSKESE